MLSEVLKRMRRWKKRNRQCERSFLSESKNPFLPLTWLLSFLATAANLCLCQLLLSAHVWWRLCLAIFLLSCVVNVASSFSWTWVVIFLHLSYWQLRRKLAFCEMLAITFHRQCKKKQERLVWNWYCRAFHDKHFHERVWKQVNFMPALIHLEAKKILHLFAFATAKKRWHWKNCWRTYGILHTKKKHSSCWNKSSNRKLSDHQYWNRKFSRISQRLNMCSMRAQLSIKELELIKKKKVIWAS